MNSAKSKRTLWYTRRNGVERGPYPEKQIGRYILLGRIRDTDELRPEGGTWQSVADHQDLVPEVMKLPPTEENRQKLLMARMREDERQPDDRREREYLETAGGVERRARRDRRRDESEQALRYRTLKHDISHPVETPVSKFRMYRYPLVFSLIVIIGFVLSFVMKQFEPDSIPPDCGALPRPGINWNHCELSGLKADRSELIGASMQNARLDGARLAGSRLSGADMEYASINLGDMKRVDLSHARLVGATLRGADLRYANLSHANLSYANLSGANIEGADFSGAILDRAIWVDQQPCVSGSVGACKRYKVRN